MVNKTSGDKKIILVTGASGQLGQTLKKYSPNESGFQWVFKGSDEMDITDVSAVRRVFEELNPDFCINCAAYTNVEMAESEEDLAFQVNAEAVKNLATVCKAIGTVLVHLSTDYVFDGSKRTPYTPQDSPNPLNAYGRSKLAGEQYIQAILDRYYIIRTSWLYSKEFGSNFYRTILEKARSGQDLKVIDDQVGCPTDTVNLSNYLVELLRGDEKFGIKHFCDGEAMSWFNFAELIILDNRIDSTIHPVNTSFYQQKAKRPEYSVLDS